MEADAAGPVEKRPIGYVLKVYPRVSETFVINEIRAQESLGQPVSVFSLHHPPDTVTHGILDDLRSPVTYVEDAVPDESDVAAARKRLRKHFGLSQDDYDRFLPRKYVRLALALARLADNQEVFHFHAHFASRAGHVVALAAALRKSTYSITAHAKDIYHSDVDKDLLRWKIAHSKFVATVTDYNLRYLHDLLADRPEAARRVVRVYNGVDLSRFESSPVPSGDEPLVLAIGRLVEKKGFDVLVNASRILLDRGYRFRCEIIGGGDEENSLRAQISERGLEDTVHLRGSMTTEDVQARLRDSTVTVLPCVVSKDGNVDALPTVLLEAMASGRPLVSTRLSGIPEIISDGDNGLLVEPNDVAGLAEAMAAILDDHRRADEMGQAGRRRAEQLFDLYKNSATIGGLARGTIALPDAA